jgi:hypothetical protein
MARSPTARLASGHGGGGVVMGEATEETTMGLIPDEHCSASREDHGCHCDHWYEDEGCCWCENRTLNLVVLGESQWCQRCGHLKELHILNTSEGELACSGCKCAGWVGTELAEGSLEWLRAQVLTEKPNPFTHTPTGMCGSRVKCEACPSDFLCAMKASEEGKAIKERWERCRDAHPTRAGVVS